MDASHGVMVSDLVYQAIANEFVSHRVSIVSDLVSNLSQVNDYVSKQATVMSLFFWLLFDKSKIFNIFSYSTSSVTHRLFGPAKTMAKNLKEPWW